MKHKRYAITAIACMLLITATMCGAAPRGDVWTEKQTEAHAIAERARAMGLDEDNPIIVECQRIWHEENEKRNMTYLGKYRITGYDTCIQCCGKTDGITSSGAKATVGRTCAAAGLPFGTVLYIEGIGLRVVEDRGVGAGVIDVLCNDHAECYEITGRYGVWIVEA